MFGKKKFSFDVEDICFVSYSETVMPGIMGFVTVELHAPGGGAVGIGSIFETPNLKRYLTLKKINAQGASVIPMNFSHAPNEGDLWLIEQLRIVRGQESIAIIDTEEVGLAIYVTIDAARSNGWINA